jgi:hypothetical protein
MGVGVLESVLLGHAEGWPWWKALSFASRLARTRRRFARLHLASYRVVYRDLLPAAFLAGFDPAERWRASLANPGRASYVATGGSGHILGFAEIGGRRDDVDAAVTGELMALHIARSPGGATASATCCTRGARPRRLRVQRRAVVGVLATNTRAGHLHRHRLGRRQAGPLPGDPRS